MRIFYGTIEDFNKRAPLPIKKHMEKIFSDFPKQALISETVGGPIYVIEKDIEVENIRLTSSDLLDVKPLTQQEEPCIEYAEWTKHGEYLFIVDSVGTNGARSYFVDKDAVTSEVLRKVKIDES